MLLFLVTFLFDVLAHALILLALFLVHLTLLEETLLVDHGELLASETQVDVLRLEVCMNDLAHAMQIVETHEALARHLPDNRKGRTLVVVSLDNLEQVAAENFEDGHKMLAMRSMMKEAV